VHETGTPWNDRSGDRLREWLGLDRERFYGDPCIAILPMGFCYPGRDANGGDKPPRPECAPLWRARLLAQMPRVELVLAIGSYAQRWHLDARVKNSLWATVAAWREYQPDVVPLPHPSWRNTAWLRRHPWFETEVVPMLRARVAAMLAS
jgi:uracil-DNA glycosylase